MNWKEIKEDSPNAFISVAKWSHDDLFIYDDIEEVLESCSGDWFVGTVYFRELFDFFDKQGIRCFYNENGTIRITATNNKFIYVKYEQSILKGWECMRDFILNKSDAITFEDRKEAEQLIFTKAFEILEESLNKSK